VGGPHLESAGQENKNEETDAVEVWFSKSSSFPRESVDWNCFPLHLLAFRICDAA
jgi:hypothetical protein